MNAEMHLEAVLSEFGVPLGGMDQMISLKNSVAVITWV